MHKPPDCENGIPRAAYGCCFNCGHWLSIEICRAWAVIAAWSEFVWGFWAGGARKYVFIFFKLLFPWVTEVGESKNPGSD
jgi:hypothetical protein